MENKKTFGAYVLQRRRELGMTQKELAEKLYVTESAVSKWERGLSYPDITILQNLCVILQVTEHELLTGSEDTSRRVSEKLAQKYRKLTRNYRIIQYVIYGMILLGCGIGNLASSHTLDWFFIAAAGVLMAASLTLVPALAALDPRFDNYKLPLAFGSFTFFLEILLLICCIYSGGTWFWIDIRLSSDCDRTAHTFASGFLPVSGRNLVSRSCYKCDLWSESLYHAGALIPASAVPVDGRKEDIHVFADRNRLTALFAAGL